MMNNFAILPVKNAISPRDDDHWTNLMGKLFAAGTMVGMALLIGLEAIGGALGLSEIKSYVIGITMTGILVTGALFALQRQRMRAPVHDDCGCVNLTVIKAGLAQKGPMRFSFVYQPKINLRTGDIAGFEILSRWSINGGPDRSIEPLIPILERTGLIHQLTDLALEAAVDLLAELRVPCPELWASVNVSARDLDNPEMLNTLNKMTRDRDISPRAVVLEVTETSAMSRSEATHLRLMDIRRAGYRIVMDDFGTGYSSLMELQRMPFHAVKIDRAFIREMLTDHTSRTLVETMILLGQRLGMEVVAEGIEDRQTVLALRVLGANYGQGYFFSKPLRIEDLKIWIAEHCATMTIRGLPKSKQAEKAAPAIEDHQEPLPAPLVKAHPACP